MLASPCRRHLRAVPLVLRRSERLGLLAAVLTVALTLGVSAAEAQSLPRTYGPQGMQFLPPMPRMAFLQDDPGVADVDDEPADEPAVDNPTSLDAAEESEDEGVDEAPSSSNAADAADTALAGESSELVAQTPPFEQPAIQPTLLDFVTGQPVSQRMKVKQTDPLLRPPFRDQPVDSAKGLAAKIRAMELDVCNRVQAIRYLGTLDCIAFPEAQEQLIEAMLNDKFELVRYEAALALTDMLCVDEDEREKRHAIYCDPDPRGKGKRDKCKACAPKHPCLTACLKKIPFIKKHVQPGGKDGRFETGYDACRCNTCCNEDVLNALAKVAYDKRDNGCFVEPSARVRAQAKAAIKCCGVCCWPAPHFPYYELQLPEPAQLPEPTASVEPDEPKDVPEPPAEEPADDAPEKKPTLPEPGEELPEDPAGEELPGGATGEETPEGTDEMPMPPAEEEADGEEIPTATPSARPALLPPSAMTKPKAPSFSLTPLPRAVRPGSQKARPVASVQTAEAPAAKTAVAKAAAPAESAARVALGPSSVQESLRGYCIVALANRQVVRADPRLTLTHRDGETYAFSSPEAMRAFQADPARYAIRFAGHDPVRYIDGGAIVRGQHLRRFGGFFYLFESTQSWDAFRTAPERYLQDIVRASATQRR